MGASDWTVAFGWPPIPRTVETWGKPSSVAVDAEGRLLIFHRGAPALMRFDLLGKMESAWSTGFFQMAHGLKVAPDGNIWVTDAGRHVIVKFAPDGKQLQLLGKPDEQGLGPDRFGGVADLAFLPNGDFYVADGYRNARVVKFDRTGKFLLEWGKPGQGPGEFHLPHAIALDARGRVYVGDRENKRIQIFDPKGNYITEWRTGAPYGLAFDREGSLWMGDGVANRVVQIDRDGKVIDSFELPVPHADGTGAHMLAVGADGAVYVAETGRFLVRKYVKKQPGAR